MPCSILVIAHSPHPTSFIQAITDSYISGAREAGHDVQVLNLTDMTFDPILHEGYKTIQPLEPDLEKAQTAIKQADHIVFAYPIWWGAMPALVKGFIDRVFLPGFAFKYRTNSPFWDKLLAGKSARVLVTMDTPPWYYRLIFHQPNHVQMRRTILGFCGFKPVHITAIGSIKESSMQAREKWLKKVYKVGFNEK